MNFENFGIASKKIAFLVLAANSPSILGRFCMCAGRIPSRVFVHLDRKKSLQEYAASVRMPYATISPKFIEDRYEIFWGGFNMIRATIALMEDALRYDDIQSLVLMSDDAFFLLRPQDVYEKLLDIPDRIDSWTINDIDPRRQRYEKFFFLDSPMTSARWLPVEERSIDVETFSDVTRRLEACRQQGKARIDLRGGSQWWAMGRDLAVKMVDMYHRLDAIRLSFEFSAIPDEHYFQSIVCLIPEWDKRLLGSPMLFDFNRNPKPYVFQHREDIQGAWPEGKLFIRKVTEPSYFISTHFE